MAGGAGDRPTDSVALNFSRVQVTFKSQNPDGTLAAPTAGGFDLKTNQKV
jgi:type VI protein secretion system component Hcp